MLKKSLLIFALILPAFCFCQTEKGIWALNSTFKITEVSPDYFEFLEDSKWDFDIYADVGYFFKNYNFLGIKGQYRKQSAIELLVFQDVFLTLNPYFRRYFGDSKLKYFGIIEGSFGFTDREFFFLQRDNKQNFFSSSIGCGLSFHFHQNTAFELTFLAPFIEKENSITSDFQIRTNIKLFLNKKNSTSQFFYWKTNYLEKGNIVFGLRSNLGIPFNNVPQLATIQSQFSVLFAEYIRWNIQTSFNERAIEGVPFYDFGARSSIEYISLFLNDDWNIWEVGIGFDYLGSGKGDWRKYQLYFLGLGFRFAGQKNVFIDLKCRYEHRRRKFRDNISDLIVELGFETFLYQNLTFNFNIGLKSNRTNQGHLLQLFSKDRRTIEINFGFNYYLLRNENQSN